MLLLLILCLEMNVINKKLLGNHQGCDMKGTLLTPRERDDLNKLFKEFDGDGNGDIDAEELKLLTENLKIMTTSEDIKIMMNQLDEDGSGTIDVDELLQLIDETLTETYTEEEIVESFKSISQCEVTDEGEITALKLSNVSKNTLLSPTLIMNLCCHLPPTPQYSYRP